MRRFARLFTALDQARGTTAKVDALVRYFDDAPDDDRLWAVALLSGRRPKRGVSTAELRQWAAEHAGLPLWLVEESYAQVGDLAETIALLLPPASSHYDGNLTFYINMIKAIPDKSNEHRKATILRVWDRLDPTGRLVFNKLLTGGFRLGVSQGLLTRALARATGKPRAELAHRLMGDWHPDSTDWHGLIHGHEPRIALSRPYPFALARQLDGPPEPLGPRDHWLAEWKWDGVRAQLVVRGGTAFVWSRGGELMTDRFPELAPLAAALPDGTVIDGELLAWQGQAPLPFGALQRRLGRKTVPARLLREAPVTVMAYDLLEEHGTDIRARPLARRRDALAALLAPLGDAAPARLSPILHADDWPATAATRATARAHRAEGLMLKRRDAPYHAGRASGGWWKWKLDPLTLDAVMVNARAGHGRRAGLYTDYTFALWDGDALVPIARAYSGLTDAEFARITAWVQRNTQARFGPVRQVTPALVFEIAFEGIRDSPRHKSGLALRFPRMARWRHDKAAAEADTLDHARRLHAQFG